MTSRTWTERLKWLYAHQGYWGINRHHRCEGRLYGLWWLYGEEWRYGNPRSGPDSYPSVVDEAMAECDRLEKEAAERQAKRTPCKHVWKCGRCGTSEPWKACDCGKEKAPDTASRSPVAALLKYYESRYAGINDPDVAALRAAIKAQVEIYEREAAHQGQFSGEYGKGFATGVRWAGDRLEGK